MWCRRTGKRRKRPLRGHGYRNVRRRRRRCARVATPEDCALTGTTHTGTRTRPPTVPRHSLRVYRPVTGRARKPPLVPTEPTTRRVCSRAPAAPTATPSPRTRDCIRIHVFAPPAAAAATHTTPANDLSSTPAPRSD